MKSYAFLDYVTQAYVALVGLLVLFFHGDRVGHWPLVVAAHALGAVGIHLLVIGHARWPGNRLLDFCRHLYPLPLWVLFYCESGRLNQMFVNGCLDGWFLRAEEAVFGGQPSLAFMEALPQRLASEILHGAYFAFYPMVAGVGLALFGKDRAVCRQYVGVTALVFAVCDAAFIFLPVVGPRVLEPELAAALFPGAPADLLARAVIPESVAGGALRRIVTWVYGRFESPGGAFPCSHVAAALSTLYFSSRHLPRARAPHAVLVALLALATVYGRYHYVVDVLAGVATAAVLIPLGNRLHAKMASASE